MTTVMSPARLSGAARPDPAPRATPPAGPSPVTMAAALNRALADSLAADDRVVVFGEDVGHARRGLPGHRRAGRRASASTASSTRRSPSPASSAPPSAWR